MANRANSIAAPANQIRGMSQVSRPVRGDGVCSGTGGVSVAVNPGASPLIVELRGGPTRTAGAGCGNWNQEGVSAVQCGSTGLAAAATNMATIAVESTSRRKSADLFFNARLKQRAAPSTMPDFQKTANKTRRNSTRVVIVPPLRAGQSAPTVDLFPLQSALRRTSPKGQPRQPLASPRRIWIRAAARPIAALLR